MRFKNQASRSCSRRRFLGQASCAAVGSTSLLSSLFNLRMASAAAAQSTPPGEDYKALVCLFLAGGNDSFNMIVPTDNGGYAQYADIRSDLALSQNSLLPLNLAGSDGRTFGIHPSMPGVQSLINQGSAAIVSNVGTLVEPTTLGGITNGSVRLPLGLYSHADQIDHWQSSVPDRRSPKGWAGALGDMLEAANENQAISMNISMSDVNVFQSGDTITPFVTGPDGGVEADSLIAAKPTAETYEGALIGAVNSLMDIDYQNIYKRHYASKVTTSIDAVNAYLKAMAGAPTLQTPFANNYLSRAFHQIARTIAMRDVLGKRRQTFFVMLGGWDHHDEVLNNQQAMLALVSQALSAFYQATEELGIANQVTTFTASDFARTLTSNGRGSDHAWGGNHLVMGGAVQGATLYGQYPELYAGNPLDTGRGRLIPSTSVDEYFAEMALWFGVETSDLPHVLPNIERFYDLKNPLSPLGYLG